jgi:hypothetical protein
MAMLDKLSPRADETAHETAEASVNAFGLALARIDTRALTDLLVSHGHWRIPFGLSWHFTTFSGNAALARELMQPARDVRARRFCIDAAALAPRKSLVAGRDVIEAIFAFAGPHLQPLHRAADRCNRGASIGQVRRIPLAIVQRRPIRPNLVFAGIPLCSSPITIVMPTRRSLIVRIIPGLTASGSRSISASTSSISRSAPAKVTS